MHFEIYDQKAPHAYFKNFIFIAVYSCIFCKVNICIQVLFITCADTKVIYMQQPKLYA